ncbi:hypothetical protein G7092_26660 [Mucilaginibacter sp. HC2]|uniref:hypothetical protein n=1 Tax=Mucilaginibacter inviolabilis TaxID=2714892 RepID=UPI00140E17C1|nr:hypothetical protein [Mucilaginibacter inviolabilis]NHA07410.1 hypothetical protein [Mucilaginibacter inviolabilis]
MDWRNFFIGVAFLVATFFFYKSRKWGNYSGELAFVNKVNVFRTWLVLIMCLLTGLVFVFKSLPF